MIMKQILFFTMLTSLSLLLSSCDSKNDNSKKESKEEKLVEVKDGKYILNLQTAPFENDATPSRPVLFEIITK